MITNHPMLVIVSDVVDLMIAEDKQVENFEQVVVYNNAPENP